MTRRRILLSVTALAVLALVAVSARLGNELRKAVSDDPLVWESTIRAFEEQDRRNPPPRDAVLFVGSSSIRMWDTLADDMAPMPVINRGFGGAKMGDLVHYADRIITPYAPRAIVVYCGSNDLQEGFGMQPKEPGEVATLYEELVARIREKLPDTPIYYVAVRQSIRGPGHKVARLLDWAVGRFSQGDPSLRTINGNRYLISPDGGADRRLLLWDGLHLNRNGYTAWAWKLRPRLLEDLGYADVSAP